MSMSFFVCFRLSLECGCSIHVAEPGSVYFHTFIWPRTPPSLIEQSTVSFIPSVSLHPYFWRIESPFMYKNVSKLFYERLILVREESVYFIDVPLKYSIYLDILRDKWALTIRKPNLGWKKQRKSWQTRELPMPSKKWNCL